MVEPFPPLPPHGETVGLWGVWGQIGGRFVSLEAGLCYRTMVDLEATAGEVAWAAENATDVEIRAAAEWLRAEFACRRLERVRLLAEVDHLVERWPGLAEPDC